MPEKTTQISQHLLRQWKAREKDTSHHKVFFQGLGSHGQPVDSFVMMPCRNLPAFSHFSHTFSFRS